MVALSEDGSRWIELTKDEFDSCTGTDLKTCPGAMAYRALNPTTCAASVWLEDQAGIDRFCNFIYQNKPFQKDTIIKLDESRYAVFSPDRSASIQCPGHPIRSVSLNGLSLVTLGCGCALATSKLVLPPQIASCNRDSLVTKVEYPINAAILADLSEANRLPVNLVRDEMTSEPWALASKPPQYKAADSAMLVDHEIPASVIRDSIKTSELLKLPNFDKERNASNFSFKRDIPSVLTAVFVLGLFALVFYRLRAMGAVLAALAAPRVSQAYVIPRAKQLPLIPECATLHDVWSSSLTMVSLISCLFLVVLVGMLARWGKRWYGDRKTNVLLQISTGEVLRTIRIMSIPHPSPLIQRSGTEIIGSM